MYQLSIIVVHVKGVISVSEAIFFHKPSSEYIFLDSQEDKKYLFELKSFKSQWMSTIGYYYKLKF